MWFFIGLLALKMHAPPPVNISVVMLLWLNVLLVQNQFQSVPSAWLPRHFKWGGKAAKTHPYRGLGKLVHFDLSWKAMRTAKLNVFFSCPCPHWAESGWHACTSEQHEKGVEHPSIRAFKCFDRCNTTLPYVPQGMLELTLQQLSHVCIISQQLEEFK